ncbi:MAG: sulfhydrogenase subunit alpha [Reinekea sp.]|jgi:sulfhydrogenase subunit alpha
MTQDISIRVPILARVEGEGALELDIERGQIHDLKLRIYEPPRFFEQLLVGRSYQEVLDVVARICGICPVAYQMSAAQALEQIFALQISPWTQAMRRLFYCGEWLESHGLHIHLLAAPDFLGFDSAPAMAQRYPDELRRGLRLHELGNDLVSLFGGRAVHPVGACVGGFYRAPAQADADALLTRLRAIEPEAAALVGWTATLPLTDLSSDFVSVALSHPDEYAINQGRLRSSAGLDLAVADYNRYFHESQVAHSSALHSHLQGKTYLTGPLARINLNWAQLPEVVRDNALVSGLNFPSRNMFHSIVARAIEIHFSVVEAIRLLSDYRPTQTPNLRVVPRAGEGFGCTEAPRGILWHHYRTDAQGIIEFARIVPPTSQNQARIEEDLRSSLIQFGLDQPADALRLLSEQVIRNYDPCISCATHFLDLRLNRRG